MATPFRPLLKNTMQHRLIALAVNGFIPQGGMGGG
jgi:hypothetical protein